MWQLEILYFASGVENDATIWANFWQFFLKFTFTLAPRNFSPRYLSKINENICSHKKLQINVYSCIIYNSQKNGNSPNVHQLMNE